MPGASSWLADRVASILPATSATACAHNYLGTICGTASCNPVGCAPPQWGGASLWNLFSCSPSAVYVGSCTYICCS
jgi:hypothetical protein